MERVQQNAYHPPGAIAMAEALAKILVHLILLLHLQVAYIAAVCTVFLQAGHLQAEDWPQWLGPRRDGVWREVGIRESLPAAGLPTLWRAKVGLGYSGPIVAHGQVYVTDRQLKPSEVERVLCFKEETGQPLWTYEYPCDYREIGYASGPRAAPTVHEGNVYTLGATGNLCCLDAATGKLVWKKDLASEYQATPPRWGMSAAPLVEADVVVVCAGAEPDGCIMAFHKDTGREVWRALGDRPTYSSPIATSVGGKRQVIVWTGDAVTSLDPPTGKSYWRLPYRLSKNPIAVATPVIHENFLLLTSFETGAKLFKLDPAKPAATLVWENKRITSLMGTTLIQDGHFYVSDNYGEFQCIEAATGKLIWRTREPTGETEWGSSVHLTPNGKRVFLFNDRGQLMVAKLSREGYQELGRVSLIAPTIGAKQERAVAWAHPAYANKHILVRNDKELLRASLLAEP
jgi:outer membrane protein assembly factor BamB